MAPRDQPESSWDKNAHASWDAAAMAVHVAMVDRMDQGVGRVVAKLREMNKLNDTLIFVLSDNGASPEVMTEPGFDRPAETRNGFRIMYPQEKGLMPAGQESMWATIGPFWATVANTPLRYWKAEMYEGGICTPMVVHWPRGLETKAGAVTHEVGHAMDVMATCIELAGATYPRAFAGNSITPVEGRSLVPVFSGGEMGAARTLAWEHINARAIRQGDWKLVARRQGPWALYDLSKDRAEVKDLAASEPQRVVTMERAWNEWAARVKVVPKPAPPGAKK
jgi:arylsulfatase